MRSITITDLVPAKVCLDIAKRVRAKAVEIARAKGLPARVHEGSEEGISGRSIGIGAPSITAHQIQINLTLNGIGAAYEWGSGLFATRDTPRKYPIRPKNTKALSFNGTNEWRGQHILTTLVMHPGVAPKPFLEPAKRSTRRDNLEEIRRINLENTRLIIKGMARKV